MASAITFFSVFGEFFISGKSVSAPLFPFIRSTLSDVNFLDSILIFLVRCCRGCLNCLRENMHESSQSQSRVKKMFGNSQLIFINSNEDIRKSFFQSLNKIFLIFHETPTELSMFVCVRIQTSEECELSSGRGMFDQS